MIAAAITFQVILLVYHQVTTLCDFFPFNGVRFYARRETLIEAGVNLVLMSLPLAGFILRAPLLMKFGVVYYFILFAVECATWWGPYFFGASPKALECYNRIHRETITIVPRRGTNPAPNLEHLILMVLTLATALATLIGYRSLQIPFQHLWIALAFGVAMAGGTFFQFCLAGGKKADAPRTN